MNTLLGWAREAQELWEFFFTRYLTLCPINVSLVVFLRVWYTPTN